ncbi:MAG: hypothetical protein JWM64_920 [Frankiales bacterium]|nr:hypothetical protein [Frankiales bacterium]
MFVLRRSRTRSAASSTAAGRRALVRALAASPTQASYAELLAISARF